jgi:hypothetical protein
MPLLRINLSKSYSPEQRQIVSDVVYTAMIEIANVPELDKLQIFAPIPTVNWYNPKDKYLGIDYTPNIFSPGVWVAGSDHGCEEGILSQNRGGSKRQAWGSEARCLDHSG